MAASANTLLLCGSVPVNNLEIYSLVDRGPLLAGAKGVITGDLRGCWVPTEFGSQKKIFWFAPSELSTQKPPDCERVEIRVESNPGLNVEILEEKFILVSVEPDSPFLNKIPIGSEIVQLNNRRPQLNRFPRLYGQVKIVFIPSKVEEVEEEPVEVAIKKEEKLSIFAMMGMEVESYWEHFNSASDVMDPTIIATMISDLLVHYGYEPGAEIMEDKITEMMMYLDPESTGSIERSQFLQTFGNYIDMCWMPLDGNNSNSKNLIDNTPKNSTTSGQNMDPQAEFALKIMHVFESGICSDIEKIRAALTRCGNNVPLAIRLLDETKTKNPEIMIGEYQQKIKQKEDEVTRLKLELEQQECVVCMEYKKTHIVLPCMHLCLCQNCGAERTISFCPLCRSAVQDIRKVHF